MNIQLPTGPRHLNHLFAYMFLYFRKVHSFQSNVQLIMPISLTDGTLFSCFQTLIPFYTVIATRVICFVLRGNAKIINFVSRKDLQQILASGELQIISINQVCVINCRRCCITSFGMEE